MSLPATFDDINSTRDQLWLKFTDADQGKNYRDAFVASEISNNIAGQIFALREASGLTQQQLAQRVGMAQERISVLENPSYGSYSLKTLLRVASAFDVALAVRFVPFSELLNWVTTAGPLQMAPQSISHDHLVPLSAAGTGNLGAYFSAPPVYWFDESSGNLGNGWTVITVDKPISGTITVNTSGETIVSKQVSANANRVPEYGIFAGTGS